MENIKDHFNDTSDKYYDAKYIIHVLEDMLEMSIPSIKERVKSSNVTVTEYQIRIFLIDTLAKENPYLEARLENPRKNIDLVTCTQQDILESYQNFRDDLDFARYDYEPYTLKYYKKYIRRLKYRISKLLYIIENIGIKNYNAIQDDLLDLDIILDSNNNILKSDIIRLITPTIYNIEKLEEKTNEANNLSTYLTNKISLHDPDKNGRLGEGRYPSKTLQMKNLFYCDLNGYVNLTEKQKQECKKLDNKITKVLVDDLFSYIKKTI